jgi:hypothetical protein
MPDKLFDYDGTFFRGMNSSMEPGSLPLGYYWNGLNILNLGGVISCRPGHKCLVQLPRGRLQGATIFKPKTGLEQLVVCIDGVVYVAPYPFVEFRFLPNVLMSPSAKQVFWAMTTQAARRINTDFSSPIEVIDPRAVLFIQDGGFTAPAWFDGSNSGHIRDNEFETPAGSSMAWVGDRLWVAVDNKVFASDIANPFSYREQTYLGGNDAFYFPSAVTAMTPTTGLEFPQLIVFTAENTSLIQANIRERAAWPVTDGMQTEIFQIGCASQRSIISHQGLITWFSQSGIVFFNAARAGKISSHMPIRDTEMQVSKVNLSSDLSTVSSALFGHFILMSVPSEDAFNKHTWVLNGAPIESFGDDSGEAWASIWTGTRPVEWVYGTIAGEERIYHVSTDADGENRLWRSFTKERLDNGCPITWAMETRAYFGQTSQTNRTLPRSPCRFTYADVGLCGIEEDLDLGIFYAGGTRGAYKQILGKKISVERGSIRFDEEITAITELFAFKPQTRRIRTQDANQQSNDLDTGTCGVESKDIEAIDDSFQLLIVGHGPATIKWIRAFAIDTPEDKSGEPDACDDETQFNTVRFDGVGLRTEDLVGMSDALAALPIAHYTSVKTAALTQDGLTAVGVGTAESIVSQKAADRVATRIAERVAEVELINALPKTFSAGEGFDQ